MLFKIFLVFSTVTNKAPVAKKDLMIVGPRPEYSFPIP
jgi:hypothetical protein